MRNRAKTLTAAAAILVALGMAAASHADPTTPAGAGDQPWIDAMDASLA